MKNDSTAERSRVTKPFRSNITSFVSFDVPSVSIISSMPPGSNVMFSPRLMARCNTGLDASRQPAKSENSRIPGRMNAAPKLPQREVIPGNKARQPRTPPEKSRHTPYTPCGYIAASFPLGSAARCRRLDSSYSVEPSLHVYQSAVTTMTLQLHGYSLLWRNNPQYLLHTPATTGISS